MTEHLLVGLWRAASVTPDDLATRIVGEWAPEALAGDTVESCTVSLAESDQGQFARHWTERHTPLAVRHHVGLWNYTQNVVRRAYTPGGGSVDGIAELHFRTRGEFATRFFDSDQGRAVILEDVKRFMARPRPETA